VAPSTAPTDIAIALCGPAFHPQPDPASEGNIAASANALQ